MLPSAVQYDSMTRQMDRSRRPHSFVLRSLIVLLGLPSVCCAQNLTQSDEAASPAYRPTVILVSSNLNLLPQSSEVSLTGLTANQIAQLAIQQSAAADLLRSDSIARKRSSQALGADDSTENISSQIQAAAAYRLRQVAASNALKLHYAIAACIQANRMFDETEALLKTQEDVQTSLVSKGIPIPDDLLLGRLKTSLEDKRIDNRSKLSILRTQLAGLIGAQNACAHTPYENMRIEPSDNALCDRIEQAYQCRCDFRTMKHLRGSINADTLGAWDNYGAILSGVPSTLKRRWFITKFLHSSFHKSEIQCAIAARQAWLDSLIGERSRLISQEVEVAFEKKKTAALRWVNAQHQVKEWDLRIEQLIKLSEAHGNIADQLNAKLNRAQSQAQQLERWLEWHQAHCELQLAIGCELVSD